MPSGYCGNDAIEYVGQRCEDACIVNEQVVDTEISTSGANGRCCLFNGCEEVEGADQCQELRGVYESGVGCSVTNPCYTWGR